MKIKIASLSYFFIVLVTALCLYFLKGNVNLLIVSYFGSSTSILATLAISLFPLLFTLFLFLFENKNKWLCIITALLIIFVFVMRLAAVIKNLSYLKFQDMLTSEKFIFYILICIIFGAAVVAFTMLSMSDDVKSKGLTLLKVSSVTGIIIFLLYGLSFLVSVFFLSDGRIQQRFFTVLSSIFLIDAFNSLIMLLSIGGLRKILYYRNSEK